MKQLLYVIRGPDGHPEAIHQRTETPEGKTFTWWTAGPDGQPVASLQGRKASGLPLYGSQHAAKWDTARRVFVVEGEKACLALANAGHRALGTLGSSVMPGPGALAVLIGLHVALWPDNDAAGIKHMQRIAAAIEGAVASLRWVTWPVAPADGDAADYLKAGLKIEDLKLVPVPKPERAEVVEFEPRHHEKRRRTYSTQESEIERFNNSVPVTLVLIRDYGLQTSPGKAVRCPWHDDKSPSLSILRDDRRAFCHSPAIEPAARMQSRHDSCPCHFLPIRPHEVGHARRAFGSIRTCPVDGSLGDRPGRIRTARAASPAPRGDDWRLRGQGCGRRLEGDLPELRRTAPHRRPAPMTDNEPADHLISGSPRRPRISSS